MRILPNQPLLRIVALICWLLGAWWMLQPGLMAGVGLPPILSAGGLIVASLLFAVGATFWLLGTDQRAGISIERKGLGLNLGYASAFISWDNIASVGVTRRRSSLLALGSRAQLGIRLHSPEQFLQSYEVRVPASSGPLARGVRLVERLVRRTPAAYEPGLADIAAIRRRTGYDIIIPEAQLGTRARALAALLEQYRTDPKQRRTLPVGYVVGRSR